MTNVWAFDPGESTGVAHLKDGELAYAGVWALRELLEICALPDADLRRRFEGVEAVVVESWRLYPGMESRMILSDFLPVQAIGMIKTMAARMRAPVTLQSASSAKRFASDAFLDAKGWKRASPHENDALRHLSLFLHRALETHPRHAPPRRPRFRPDSPS